MLHSLADHALSHALNMGLLYREGFGDRTLLEHVVELIETYTRARPAGEIVMRDARQPSKLPGGEVRFATFESPALTPLPEASRIARVEIWTPTRRAFGAMCILLATTGDEGFFLRRPLARRLMGEGIGSIILENPYYGSRRPPGQRGPVLRAVVDQLAMNTATVDEARALLGWIRGAGYLPGVTGFSQGGFMAAFAAALVDHPVVVVPRAAGTHAAPVLTEWPLRRAIHWRALARESGGVWHARAELARHLLGVDLTRHPAPVAPELATVLVGHHDRIFPAHTGEALHRHWEGSRLLMSNAGHVTSVLFDDEVHARAVVEGFRRAAGMVDEQRRRQRDEIWVGSCGQPRASWVEPISCCD